MMRMTLSALLLLLASPSVAETVVLGKVLSTDGEPLKGATIEARTLDGRMLAGFHSRADGSYTLRGLPDGMVDVFVRSPERLTMSYTLRPLLETTTLPTVRLVEDVGLTVRMEGDDGEPIVADGILRVDGGVQASGWRLAPREIPIPEDGVARVPRAVGERLTLKARAVGWAAVRHEVSCDEVSLRWRPASTAPASTTSAAPEAEVRLRGRVLDHVQAPIVGALVWVEGSPAVRTNTDGVFDLNVTSGLAKLQAAAAGFFSTEIDLGYLAGGQIPTPTLVLEPRLKIAGRVVDDEGQPLSGVEIALRYDPAGSRSSALRDRSGGLALSDRNGRFRLTGLLADVPYQVFFRRDGYAPAIEEIPAHQPGNPPAEMDITLKRGQRARGWVQDRDGNAIVGAVVVLEASPSEDLRTHLAEIMEPDRLFRHETRTDSWGRFLLRDIAPGRYVLRTEAPGFAAQTRRGVLVSTATSTDRRPPDRRPPGSRRQLGLPSLRRQALDLGTVELRAGLTISGVVRGRGGVALENVAVHLRSADEDAAMLTSSAPHLEPRVTITDGTGRFSVPNRVEGELRTLVFRRHGYSPVELEVEVGIDDRLTVRMQPTGTVAGRILDPYGNGVLGALVELESTGISGKLQTVTQGDGAFLFENVTPGTINVSALAPGFRRSPADAVDLAVGEIRDGLELRLSTGNAVAGRVRAPDGAPVRGARIGLARMNGRGPTGMTDSEGRFLLNGVPPGRRTVYARHPAFGRTAREIEVGSTSAPAELRFAGGNTMAGRIVDNEGAVGGAVVTLALTRERREGQHVESRADGSFSFGGLVAGSYNLFVRKEGYAPLVRIVEIGGGRLELRLEKVE